METRRALGRLAQTASDCRRRDRQPHAGEPFCPHRIEDLTHPPDLTRRNGMARRNPPRKVTYFEPIPPRLARNTIIESTFEVGRRFRCTMRVDCGQLEPGAVIRPVPGEWHPRMPERLDEEELAENFPFQRASLSLVDKGLVLI